MTTPRGSSGVAYRIRQASTCYPTCSRGTCCCSGCCSSARLSPTLDSRSPSSPRPIATCCCKALASPLSLISGASRVPHRSRLRPPPSTRCAKHAIFTFVCARLSRAQLRRVLPWHRRGEGGADQLLVRQVPALWRLGARRAVGGGADAEQAEEWPRRRLVSAHGSRAAASWRSRACASMEGRRMYCTQKKG